MPPRTPRFDALFVDRDGAHRPLVEERAPGAILTRTLADALDRLQALPRAARAPGNAR